MKKLGTKEKLFCAGYAALGNMTEAAMQAGYPAGDAPQQAARLMQRAEIRLECRRLLREEETQDLGRLALVGLRRLAFGGIGDAVRLACDSEDLGRSVQGLDLFCVSEIRQGKGGGLEIKFHDRARALELLLQHAGGAEKSGVASLYAALNQSAAAGQPGEVCKDAD